MGITGAAKTELRPKQQAAAQTLLTKLIRMSISGAQGAVVGYVTGRKQRLASKQGALSFSSSSETDNFHYKLSDKCHSEQSEESRINFRPILPRANEQRCFASINMTALFIG